MRALLNIAMASVLLTGCRTVPPRAPLAGDPVAPDVSVLRGRFVSGAQPDGNSVLLRGRDGLIVVDSGRHAAHTARIVEAARAADLPVVAIVNTHWHLDHVARNTALRAAYPQAEVLASDAIHGALEGFLADYRAQLVPMLDKREVASELVAEGWRAEIARIDAGAQLIPTRPVTADKATTLAGRRGGWASNAMPSAAAMSGCWMSPRAPWSRATWSRCQCRCSTLRAPTAGARHCNASMQSGSSSWFRVTAHR